MEADECGLLSVKERRDASRRSSFLWDTEGPTPAVTNPILTYERKGLDLYKAPNHTRIMIASNETWIVPAASGGRRWFFIDVGNEWKQDHAFFASLNHEMANGGLEAMLYDLQRIDFANYANVRKAPVTKGLVEQRMHSYDNKMRWWRDVLTTGTLYPANDLERAPIALNETNETV